MSAVFVVGVLAAADVINLPGALADDARLPEGDPQPSLPPRHLPQQPEDPSEPARRSWRFEPEAPKTQVESRRSRSARPSTSPAAARPGNLHTVLAYDTRSRRWSEPTKLPIGLNHGEAAAYDGELYLAGGYLDGEEPDRTTSGSTTRRANAGPKLPPMRQPRGGGAAAVIGDKLYVADGGAPDLQRQRPREPIPHPRDLRLRTRELVLRRADADRSASTTSAPVPGRQALRGRRPLTPTKPLATPSTATTRPTNRWTRCRTCRRGSLLAAGSWPPAARSSSSAATTRTNWEDGGGFGHPERLGLRPEASAGRACPTCTSSATAAAPRSPATASTRSAAAICPGLKPDGPVATHTVESLPSPRRRYSRSS